MFLSNWKMSSSSEKVKEVVYLGCCLPRENSTMWLARYIQSAFLIDFCFNHSSRLTFSIEIRMSSEIGEIFQSKTNLLDWKIFQSVERLKFSIFGIKRVTSSIVFASISTSSIVFASIVSSSMVYRLRVYHLWSIVSSSMIYRLLVYGLSSQRLSSNASAWQTFFKIQGCLYCMVFSRDRIQTVYPTWKQVRRKLDACK